MGYLVISRNVDEKFRIGDNVIVTVLGVQGKQVKIGIEAPKEVAVHREEVWQRIQDGEIER